MLLAFAKNAPIIPGEIISQNSNLNITTISITALVLSHNPNQEMSTGQVHILLGI